MTSSRGWSRMSCHMSIEKSTCEKLYSSDAGRSALSRRRTAASTGLSARPFTLFEERWCASVLERLTAATQRALDDLLVTGSADETTDAEATESRRSILNELHADAGAISLESVLAEIAKLERLRKLGLPPDLFRGLTS
jgi:hypothetical protein